MKTRPSLSLSPDNRDQPRQLRELMARAALHHQAEQRVLRAIPAGLATGVRFVSYHDGKLVLQADNATQASQLRFRQREIMAELREEEAFQFVWKLKVRVQPRRYSLKKPPAPMTLSKENARLLKEEAGHTKDKALREVLEKLASHVDDPSN
ncbi:MAG: DciA family protein [Marinobacter sp.]